MKAGIRARVLGIAVLCGLAFWVVDAVVDAVFFYGDETLEELAVTDVPVFELYYRLSFLALFLAGGYLIGLYLEKTRKSQNLFRNIFQRTIPLCITDLERRIVMANEGYESIFGPLAAPLTHCYDSRPGPSCHTGQCPIARIQGGATLHTCETMKKTEGGDDRHFIVTATPLIGVDGALEGIIESFQDITPRVRLEKQKEELIVKLRIALENVRQLQKLLPICSSCKKIRDDQGYWMQLESYFSQHSEISFTHGLCPACAEKLYGVLLRPEPEKK